jgi:hypothetical protein
MHTLTLGSIEIINPNFQIVINEHHKWETAYLKYDKNVKYSQLMSDAI